MSDTISFAVGAAERPLNSRDFRTLVLAALGGALEFYDFVVYVFFASVFGELFFPAAMPPWLRLLQAFGIFAAGYLARPLGGVIIGHFGDLLGRKRMFTLSIFLMAVPTLAIGVLPTYPVIGIAAPLLLPLMRVLQGIAVGGEVPGAWVFVAEHVPGRHFGVAIGTLTSGLTAGILLGSLIAGAINSAFTPAEVVAYAWRLPFLLGGVFGLIAVYLRRFLEETPVFKEMAARRSLSRELPLKTVLREHRGTTALAVLLTWVLAACVVVVILYTPTYLQQVHGVSPGLALRANSLATLGLSFGCIAFGWANDRFGTRPTMLTGFVAVLVSSYAFYAALPLAAGALMARYAVAGFCIGAIATVPIVIVRSFPPPIRFTGLSFSYNVSYAVLGGLTPVALTLWLRVDRMAPAHYVGALAVLGIVLAFAPLSGRERRP